MSRILKYKESLHRFIKDKSYLTDEKITSQPLNNYVINKIQNDDLIVPILLLTVMNNQNKKNHISMQGYYVSSCIEFLNVLIELIEKRNEIVINSGLDSYIKLQNNLINLIYKSINHNFESIKNVIQSPNIINVIINSLNALETTIRKITSIVDLNIKISNKNCNLDIVTWYLKDKNDLVEKIKKIKQINKDSYNEYLEKKYTGVIELALILGYIMGGGDVKDINKLKKQAKFFSVMYKISKDFDNLENDINSCTTSSLNYVINYGLQDAYEQFLLSKQKFIEESMMQDTYTNTIKEIIDILESKVDFIIDNTSPDLKSNFSSVKT